MCKFDQSRRRDAVSGTVVFHENRIPLEWCDANRIRFMQPVASTLEKLLKAPALLVPFGQASDNCHLSNERLSRENLLRGKNVIKNLLHEIEQQGHIDSADAA